MPSYLLGVVSSFLMSILTWSLYMIAPVFTWPVDLLFASLGVSTTLPDLVLKIGGAINWVIGIVTDPALVDLVVIGWVGCRLLLKCCKIVLNLVIWVISLIVKLF